MTENDDDDTEELIGVARDAKSSVLEGDEDLVELIRTLQMSANSVDFERLQSDRTGIRIEETGECAKRVAESLACAYQALQLALEELEIEGEDLFVQLGNEKHTIED